MHIIQYKTYVERRKKGGKIGFLLHKLLAILDFTVKTSINNAYLHRCLPKNTYVQLLRTIIFKLQYLKNRHIQN